jgi:type I restriction enzyme S subunit
MAGEWPHVSLGELVQNADAQRIPLSGREREKRRGPFPYYGATGVMDYVDDFLFEGLHLLVAEDGSVERPDGRPFLQLVSGRFWVNNHAHVLRGATDADTKYLYYALSTVAIRPFMSGSVQAKLSQANLNRIPTPYPRDESDRHAITRILDTLDGKIELNRRMNETLEAMARALFKSWFVDFDPARAKVEGRDPGLPKPVSDLFPNCFEDSELGDLPRGWSAPPLQDAIEVNPTRRLKKGDIAPYLDMASMPTRGHIAHAVIRRAFGSGMRFTNGDTLVARITPCLENGKTAYVDFLQDEEVGWGSTEYIVLRPKPPLPPEFAYCLARSHGFREFAIQSMTGSSGRQRVPAEALAHYRIAVPDSEVANRFSQFVRPLFARAANAAYESRALATLRDALLPKLISGELRVTDV